METEKVKKFIGRDLSSFKIIEMMEVYKTNSDGLRTTSLGFFKDPDIAIAFAGSQTDANDHKTEPALILTDGKDGFIIDTTEVKLFNDEDESLRIKERIIAKLSPAECKILGI